MNDPLAARPEEAVEAPEPGEETGAALPERPSVVLSLLLVRFRALWPWLVVAVLAFLGWRELRQIDIQGVRAILRSTGSDLLLTLLLTTAVNLTVAGLYDVAALGPLRRGPSFTARWSTGVITFAWSNFLTFGPLAGPALRLWLYRPLGISSPRARAALTSVLAAFSLGLVGLCVAAALPLPTSLDTLTVRLLMVVPMAALTGALMRALPRLRRAPAAVRAWEGHPFALSAVATLDWLLAWLVFHAAITELHGGIDPLLSLRVFFLGQLVGLASFVPGGLGSADAFWLVTLSGAAGGHDKVLASLVLYRAVYYVLPWAFSTLLLAGHLVRAGRRTGAMIRAALASYAFFCGAVLLASAATPALADRMAFLRKTVPMALVEVSHGFSVVLGFLLLVISRGLARGYRSSYALAVAFFMAGSLTTFLKGLDFEEALLSLGAVALLLVFRQSFHRRGHLRPPIEFVVSVTVFAIALFAAVGFGSYGSNADPTQVFSRFGHGAQPERFLRSLLLLVSLSAVALLHVAQRARSRDRLPHPREIDRAVEDCRAWAPSTNPLLVGSGDKAIFRAERDAQTSEDPPAGFIEYRTAGRFLVAYSDPVCPEGMERPLLAAFLEHAATLDRDVILYQIAAGSLPLAHDFGFTFFKLGEEAIVDLRQFDLKGNKSKKLRHRINSVERAGGTLEIVEGESLRPLLPELRRISEDWLSQKHGTEKSFSIGRFDESYLMRCPVAIVRDGAGKIVAFANLLLGQPGGEISIDLMRYAPASASGDGLGYVMDYLFAKLMLHGKERGYTRFNLGMAPLSSVGELRWARPFERLAHLFFRHGENWYNFQGVRQFKEKFEPIWEPRYMAYPKPWDWPLAITSTAVLIAGGWPAVLAPRRRPA